MILNSTGTCVAAELINVDWNGKLIRLMVSNSRENSLVTSLSTLVQSQPFFFSFSPLLCSWSNMPMLRWINEFIGELLRGTFVLLDTLSTSQNKKKENKEGQRQMTRGVASFRKWGRKKTVQHNISRKEARRWRKGKGSLWSGWNKNETELDV